MNADCKEYYEFVDDITLADIAVRCQAKTVEKIFSLNIEALLKICLDDPNTLQKVIRHDIIAEDCELGLLLVKVLNEIVFIKDVKGLLLQPDHIEISNLNDSIRCSAVLSGDYINNAYESGVDPKAVTHHKARCEKVNDIWESFIVIDV